jgi:hypothetical protein
MQMQNSGTEAMKNFPLQSKTKTWNKMVAPFLGHALGHSTALQQSPNTAPTPIMRHGAPRTIAWHTWLGASMKSCPMQSPALLLWIYPTSFFSCAFKLLYAPQTAATLYHVSCASLRLLRVNHIRAPSCRINFIGSLNVDKKFINELA